MFNPSGKTALFLASAVGVVLPIASALAGPMPAPTAYKFEKCYGIVAAGKNDCAATGSHSCAGQAKVSNDPQSWVYLPTGTCSKIAGASMMPKT